MNYLNFSLLIEVKLLRNWDPQIRKTTNFKLKIQLKVHEKPRITRLRMYVFNILTSSFCPYCFTWVKIDYISVVLFSKVMIIIITMDNCKSNFKYSPNQWKTVHCLFHNWPFGPDLCWTGQKAGVAPQAALSPPSA